MTRGGIAWLSLASFTIKGDAPWDKDYVLCYTFQFLLFFSHFLIASAHVLHTHILGCKVTGYINYCIYTHFSGKLASLSLQLAEIICSSESLHYLSLPLTTLLPSYCTSEFSWGLCLWPNSCCMSGFRIFPVMVTSFEYVCVWMPSMSMMDLKWRAEAMLV